MANTTILSDMHTYIWVHLFKSMESSPSTPSHKLLDLQRKLKDLEGEFSQSEILEYVKLQILTLMFSEAVRTLRLSQSYYIEAALLAFVFEEARLINLQHLYKHRGFSMEDHSAVEEVLSDFADEIANKFPLEAISYLCAIDNNKRKALAIKHLFEKNSLIPTFFNTNNQSYQMLDKFKTLITSDIYGLVLNYLIETSEIDLNRLTVSYVRILEEAKNSGAIMKMLIDIFYWEVQKLQSTDQMSRELERDEQFTEAKRFLTQLFNNPAHRIFFERNELYNDVILAKHIYDLFYFYAKDSNAKRAVDRIEHSNFFYIHYEGLSNKLKILFLQMVEQVLTIYHSYERELNPRTINYDSIINQLKGRLSEITNYFYERMRNNLPTPERPFNNFNKITANIKDLLNTLKNIQIINR